MDEEWLANHSLSMFYCFAVVYLLLVNRQSAVVGIIAKLL